MSEAASCIERVLGQGGLIAEVIGGEYEAREPQLAMARGVARNLHDRGTLLVEAGTGVGKSLAYLVPAVQRIIEKRERVVVATNTIALQEQLLGKDVPLLARIAHEIAGDRDDAAEEGPAFSCELVKGRGNYLSIRRLQLASARADKLMPDAASRRSLDVIQQWAYETADGTLSSLPALDRMGVWDHARSDSGNCMGRKCPTYEQCFYQRARRRMERADLLICNHALFFSDLALRAQGVGFLPEYDHVILDESHMVEDVASEHFGVSLAEGRVRHLLNTLANERRGTGALSTIDVDGERLTRALTFVQRARRGCDRFFEQFVARAGQAESTIRLHDDDDIENPLSEPMLELTLSLKRIREDLERDEDRFELASYIERCRAIADDAEVLSERQAEGCAYWAEVSKSASMGVRVRVACSPIDVGPVLNAHLFSGDFSVTLTSATLATREPGGGEALEEAGFAHVKSRLGCTDALTMCLGSPFDYASLVTVHVATRMPDPREPHFIDSLGQHIEHHTRATDGGAFVLFTSYATMKRVAERIRGALEDQGYPVWVHGVDGSRAAILEGYRANDRSVLFGTMSFWQGVDVRGRGLRNVMITRLPFEPPDRPLTEARMELLRERGGNPFVDDSLPRAILRFKQGFGRLVRSGTDSGRVVVLDPRIMTKSYGKRFLAAIPSGVRIITDGEHVAEDTVE